MGESGDRDRRRVSDATRKRIDDLADGWSTADDDDSIDPEMDSMEETEPVLKSDGLDTEPTPKSPPPLPPRRAKRASVPPPPPRSKTPSAPPPPPARPKRPSAPPPTPSSARRPPPLIAETDRHPRTDFERDEDATILQVDLPQGAAPGSQLRKPSVLPRKRGLAGDVRYVFTALFGGAEARKELAEARKAIETERVARQERVIALARHAVADGSIDLAIVDEARERLASVAEERSRRAGAVAATDADIGTVERQRTEESKAAVDSLKALEADLAKIRQELTPLEKAAAAARDKGARLKASIARLDKKIQAQESSLVTVKGPRNDEASVQAALASLRAEREVMNREEPAIAAELDDLEPKIAALNAARTETQASVERTRSDETEAEVRYKERIEALRARRAVEERAVKDAERRSDDALAELGEQLCLDRPQSLQHKLQPIDTHEVSIATLERRALELSELVDGIDKAKVTRGVAIMLLCAAAIGGVLYLLLS